MSQNSNCMNLKERNDYLDKVCKWFDDMEDTNQSIETLDRGEVEKYHEEAVNSLLKYVYTNNKFYFNRLKAVDYKEDSYLCIDDFEKIPFLTKDDIRNYYKEISVCNNFAHICKSTGTTGGKPTYIGHTKNELYKYYLAPKYPSLMGFIKNSIVANALPYEMSSSALTFHHEFQQLLNCTILPVGKGGVYSNPKIAVEFMRDWGANVITTTPSYAIVLYEVAIELGLNPKELGIKCIFLTGEGCSDNFRKRVKKLWGCEARILYGSLESMLIGLDCKYEEGLHIADGQIYIEIIDVESGKRLESGQVGEIVVTTLLREGMPLIRYKTGDLGYIDENLCECGVTLPRLFLRGRVIEQLEFNGEKFSPFYIENLLMEIEEIGNWYRLIVNGNNLTIEVEKIDEEVDEEDLIQKIQSKIEFNLNCDCNVRVVAEVLQNKGNGKVTRVVIEGDN